MGGIVVELMSRVGCCVGVMRCCVYGLCAGGGVGGGGGVFFF